MGHTFCQNSYPDRPYFHAQVRHLFMLLMCHAIIYHTTDEVLARSMAAAQIRVMKCVATGSVGRDTAGLPDLQENTKAENLQSDFDSGILVA